MHFDSPGKIKRNAVFSAIFLAALGVVVPICPAEFIPTKIRDFGYSPVILALVLTLDFLRAKSG